MSDETVIEGHPVIPDPEHKMLHPGATARIYRDAEVLVGQILVPSAGPVELRHLAPGSYVLKDEEGGYAEVAIDPLVETTVVHTNTSRRQAEVRDGTAEPGSSFVQPAPKPAEPLRPIYPVRGEVNEPDEHPSVDDPVLGEPGSALITELPDPDETPDRTLEMLKPGYSAPTDFTAEDPPDEQLPPRAKEPEREERVVEQPVVIDDRKRSVDPSQPDPKAGEIAATVMPGEQVTEDPAPVSARRKQPRAAKPKKPSDG
jgi:hypothetical protein